MQAMTISKLASQAGVGVETVRYYQRLNLMPTPERPAGDGLAGGVRRYSEDDARRLRFIRSAKAAGFSLEEVAELIELDASADRKRARQLAKERIDALDAKIAELQAARQSLEKLARACGGGGSGPCPILMAFND